MRYGILIIALLIQTAAISIAAQTNEFTYQGKLTDTAGTAASYDFQFNLCAAPSGGIPLGTRERLGVPVTNGVFTVTLDFPAANFTGLDRFLEIRIKPAGSGGSYTTLTPRQQINSSPYAIKSLNAENAVNADSATIAATAATATNALQLGGVPANQYLTTAIMDAAGNSTFVGLNTGRSGNANTFVGGFAGESITTGSLNTFVGTETGRLNTTGFQNSFYGVFAGRSNSTGGENSFFGVSAGRMNVGGNFNSFFGKDAGRNSTASSNSFFGNNAGFATSTGGGNTFVGVSAGTINTTGSNNTLVGTGADLGAANLSFATAIGVGAVVNASNTIVLGRSVEIVRVPGDFATVGTVSAGVLSGPSHVGNTFTGTTINATGQYQIAGNRVLSVSGTNNTFVGRQTGTVNTGSNNSFLGFNAGNDNDNGSDNSFFGSDAGGNTTSGSDNTFIGRNAGDTNTVGTNNTVIGSGADVTAVDSGGAPLNFATAIGAGAVVTESNKIVLGRADGSDLVRVEGRLSVGDLTSMFPGITHICNTAGSTLGLCASSLRYKTNINRFNPGLNLINQLKPITFDWKDGGMHDLGLGAEDVAEVEPLLVTYNKDGQVQGVKYDRIGVVLINAVKEQQAQIGRQEKRIEDQDKRLEQQAKQIAGMRALLCAAQPNATICNEKDQ